MIIVGYNGVEGCPLQTTENVNGRVVSVRSPGHFDPGASPEWTFTDNISAYAAAVAAEYAGQSFTE
jgi:hypothetical protein